MNKIVLGLLVGGILGIFDGLSAWFTPAVRAQLLTIVIGSTVKGLIAGVLIGYFAKKVNSLPLGLLFGLGVGLLLAYAVAAMPDPTGKHYYFEIMLPGAHRRNDCGLRHAAFRAIGAVGQQIVMCGADTRPPLFDLLLLNCSKKSSQRRRTGCPPRTGILCPGLASMRV